MCPSLPFAQMPKVRTLCIILELDKALLKFLTLCSPVLVLIVGRRLQLHRGIVPIMLQSTLDPGCANTSMSVLRAEAIRTAKELGFLKTGDRVITVDRTVGKAHDMHHYSHNMKVATIREN